jgi:hypothetical protein
MMISWCHYSDAGTSHRDREPICSGVQCSKISSARRRMCRSPPCTICLLQYHLHTLSSTDVPTVKRRCGAVVKEVFNGACSAANKRGLMMASLASLTRSAPGPARLGISGRHHHHDQSGSLAMSKPAAASRGIICVLAMYRRSFADAAG